MNQTLKSNLTDGRTWTRLVYMLLFAVVFYVAGLVTAFVVAVQFASRLFTGEVNQQLAEFGDGLADYFRQMVAFLTFRTEHKPFPFAPWPQADTGAAPTPPDAVFDS